MSMEGGNTSPNRVVIFGDEIGTIPKIVSLEMLFSAGRSRRSPVLGDAASILQSYAQREKKT